MGDLLKIIQLGLTFFNKEGNTPEGVCTWQFNFKFNLSEDMYAEDSVELLQNSGIQFERHEREGIETVHFAEILIVSGIVLLDDVKYPMKSCKNLKGGLQEVADSLEVERIGPQHQAGSDSLLTGMAFFRMIEVYFEDDLDDSKYLGHLYGLGTPGQPASASPSADEAAKIEES